MSKKVFILYDGRAKTLGPDLASIIHVVNSEKEAFEDGVDLWEDYDALWFEYDLVGREVVNEKVRWDIPPNNSLNSDGEKRAAG